MHCDWKEENSEEVSGSKDDEAGCCHPLEVTGSSPAFLLSLPCSCFTPLSSAPLSSLSGIRIGLKISGDNKGIGTQDDISSDKEV
ncbi:hypothetical protein AQUCO_00900909v1 [Aquilegia coerulea]|uniref:Uncharacterized protein n=1 Tax=Aquilegia coerulea TaxID=218851 RepID=A0A2G5EG26_AQUCA|nr:hypothetical protein AQUCO_00900909v1 [Aquilegia coerulea]